MYVCLYCLGCTFTAGVQYLLPATYTALKAAPRGVDLVHLAQLLSGAPAQLAGLGHRKGKIVPGMDADLVVSEPAKQGQATTASRRVRESRAPLCPLQPAVQAHAVHFHCVFIIMASSWLAAHLENCARFAFFYWVLGLSPALERIIFKAYIIGFVQRPIHLACMSGGTRAGGGFA